MTKLEGEGPKLERVLGVGTTALVGLGVAIGSGILRTPPVVAQQLRDPVWILVAWGLGGLAMLASSLVMAELATRFPRSGGEYAWLQAAYGRFTAFFFGWGYTVFIVGGGAGTIAAAFGDAAVELIGGTYPRAWAGGAVIVVVLANMAGIRAGAAMQNLLTVLKVVIVLGVFGLALWAGAPPAAASVAPVVTEPGLGAWILALPPVIWAYAGSTDAVKLGGEIRDPSRTIPRALFASIGSLALLYLLVNAGLLYALGVDGLAESELPVVEVTGRVLGPAGAGLVAAASSVVFLGGLSSTMLATVRVAWALGRDGLGFGFLGRMSPSQSPNGALAFVGAIAFSFAVFRDFESILGVYFLAGAILFGLVYASLLVFRARDPVGGPPQGVFRCPAPHLMVGLMLTVQGAMAIRLVLANPFDSLLTLGALAALAVLGYGWVVARVERDG
mgnify:FL=1